VDITAFGATSKAVTKGLGDAKITVQFFQDFAGRQGPRDPAAAHRFHDRCGHRGARHVGGPLGDQPGRADDRSADELQHAERWRR
jgi:hypothetical protein